jgi:hypothetical protein
MQVAFCVAPHCSNKNCQRSVEPLTKLTPEDRTLDQTSSLNVDLRAAHKQELPYVGLLRENHLQAKIPRPVTRRTDSRKNPTLAEIEKIMSLPQQNVPQPGNRQCALVQGAVVEVGEREVLASGRFIGAAQAPPFNGTYVISR